jgi:hypothetical protein
MGPQEASDMADGLGLVTAVAATLHLMYIVYVLLIRNNEVHS